MGKQPGASKRPDPQRLGQQQRPQRSCSPCPLMTLPRRRLLAVTVLLLVAIHGTVQRAAAQAVAPRPSEQRSERSSGRAEITPAVAPELAAKLTAPFRSAVTQKPLRQSLTEIASISRINLWIDRRVDPQVAVDIPAGAKTVFQALAHAAQSAGLEVVAAGNVVLVGRQEWVTTLAGAILALPSELIQADSAPPIDWPALTTPNEALKIAAGAAGPDTLALPHDLWPAVSWRGMTPSLAGLLITAQFDLMPVDPALAMMLRQDRAPDPDVASDENLLFSRDLAAAASMVPPHSERSATAESAAADRSSRQAGSVPRRSAWPAVSLQPLQAPATLRASYPSGPYVPQLRQAALAADPQARFRAGRPGTPLELRGSPAAHAAASAVYLRHAGSQAGPAASVDETRFTLRLRDAPAQDVFAQLAATAGKQLQISPAAAAACRHRVTLEAREVTLAELAERVASEIGVTASWDAQRLRIDAAAD